MIQIVVIDDGSRPDDAHANEQIVHENCETAAYHYLDSAGATGAGPSFARNVGITLSTGRSEPSMPRVEFDTWIGPSRFITMRARPSEKLLLQR